MPSFLLQISNVIVDEPVVCCLVLKQLAVMTDCWSHGHVCMCICVFVHIMFVPYHGVVLLQVITSGSECSKWQIQTSSGHLHNHKPGGKYKLPMWFLNYLCSCVLTCVVGLLTKAPTFLVNVVSGASEGNTLFPSLLLDNTSVSPLHTNTQWKSVY